MNEALASKVEGFDAGNIAAAIEAGAVPKAAALCCDEATLASGATLLSVNTARHSLTQHISICTALV